MGNINKDIAVLFPFKVSLGKNIPPKIIINGGATSIDRIRGILPKISIRTNKKLSIDKQVYKVLTDGDIRYGPKKYTLTAKKNLVEKVDTGMLGNKRIAMYIAGFPHKMPNPLFTNHKLPDLGELAVLFRLNSIGKLLSRIYKPGFEVVVCIETTVFPHLAYVSQSEGRSYAKYLGKIVKMFDLNYIKIVDLISLQKKIPNFKTLHKSTTEQLKKRYISGNKVVEGQFERTWPVIFSTLKVRGWRYKEIIDFFNYVGLGYKLANKSKYSKYAKFAYEATFDYLAYNMAKRESKMMENAYPDGIKLTVTPKQNSFGVWWIKKEVNILPYYGLPLVKNGNFFNVDYAHDATRLYTLKSKYLEEYSEKEPFYYEII